MIKTQMGIYPCFIAVAVSETVEEITKVIKPMQGNHFATLDDDGDECVDAYTFKACSVNNGQMGVCIRVIKPMTMPFATYTHESCHAADIICKLCGVKHKGLEDGEAYAYIAGFIAETMKSAVDSFINDKNISK